MFGSGGKKISIDDLLFQKLKVVSDIIGCSVDEFVAKALEKEAERVMAETSSQNVSAADVDDIANRLKGLGYLD